ncbi:MAG: hypothetical protein KAQ98_04785 [Bacteriovoracaceae bacterium]|nr:hypothetical protein [Bacteriovoracaceae bacterium]
MNFKSKLSVILMILTVVFSCGKREVQEFPKSSDILKSSQALKSCNALKFPADIGFNGHFLYHFTRCASNKDHNGNETLEGAVNIVNTFGVSGLNILTDFMKIDPERKDGNLPSYPLIRLITTFMERGAFKNGSYDNHLLNKRFGDLQFLLEGYNPYWVTNLLFEINDANKLESFLDRLVLLWTKVEEKSFLGLAKTFLSHNEKRDVLIKSIRDILDNNETWDGLTSLMTLENSYKATDKSKESCLKSWLVPKRRELAPRDLQKYCEPKSVSEMPETGADRIENMMDDFGPDGRKKIASFVAAVFERIMDKPPEERLSFTRRLISGTKKAYMEQAGPLRYLTGLAHLSEGTKVKKIEEIFNAVMELISNPEVYALSGANMKMGSSRLHEKIGNLFFEGGQIPGCSDLKLRGLKEMSDNQDVSDWFVIVNDYLTTNDKCRHDLPPLASFIINELEDEIGCETGQTFDNLDADKRFCTTDKELEILADSLRKIQSGTGTLVEKSRPDSTLLKNLLKNTLGEVKNELKKDKWHLRWLHLAPGIVKIKHINRIMSLVEKEDNLSAERIAHLDRIIADDSILGGILFEDFLENILDQRLSHLSSTLEEFNGLLELKSDFKFYRILTGIYNDGPFEQIIKNQMYMNGIVKSIPGDLPEDVFRVSEYLSRLRISGSIFQNQRLDSMDNRINHRLLGDRNRSMGFSESKFKFSRQKPLKLNNIFEFSTSDGFTRFDDLLKNGDMTSKDVKAENAETFANWIQETLFSKTIEDDYWVSVFSKYQKDGLSFNEIPVQFFDIEPWTIIEARKLGLFYSSHYLSIPTLHPEADETYRFGTNKKIKRQYLTLPIFNNRNWSTFLEYFPNDLKRVNETGMIQFSELASGLFGQMDDADYASLFDGNQWKHVLNKQTEIYDFPEFEGNRLEAIKLLGSLNLLTMNRKKNFMPLLGTSNHCWVSDTERADCPITFQDAVTNEATITAFSSIKQYSGKILLAQLCPYLAENQGFSDDFSHRMSDLLGISLSDEEKKFCAREDINFYRYDKGVSEKDRIPKYIQEKIVSDLEKMGRSSKLKPGLNSLIARIRFHKLKKLHGGFNKIFVQRWTESQGIIPFQMQAPAMKILSDHKGFLAARPGFINIYMNYLNHELLEKTNIRILQNAIARYGARVGPNQHPERGVMYELLHDFLATTLQEAIDRNDDVEGWLIDIMLKIGKKPRLIEAITELVSYPSDLETLNIFNNMFVLLIKHLREEGETNSDYEKFSWNNPGLFIVKQTIKQEFWWMITDITGNYSLSETRNALNFGTDVILRLGTTENEIKPIMQKLLSFLKEEFTAVRKSNDKKSFATASVIERDILRLYISSWKDGQIEDINKVMQELLTGHTSFDNSMTPSIRSQLSQLFEWSMTGLPGMTRDYQSVVSSKKFTSHGSYLRKLLKSLINPFNSNPKINEGAKSLAGLLGDPRLGTWDGLVKPLLSIKKYQRKFSATLSVLKKGRIVHYQRALIEMDLLLQKTAKMLGFLVRRVDWSENSSPDTKNAVETMVRLSGTGNVVRRKQIDLMTDWLQKARNENKIFYLK